MVFEAEHQTVGSPYIHQVSLDDWLSSGHRQSYEIFDEHNDIDHLKDEIGYLREVLGNVIMHMHSVKPFSIEEISTIVAGDRNRKIIGILPSNDYSKQY